MSEPDKNKKVEEKTGCLHFLWNGKTGEFLGRTGSSWLKIFIFYVIFYFALAAFFGLLLFCFYCTLPTHETLKRTIGKAEYKVYIPTFTGSNSRIGNSPGVGFRPQPDQNENVESTLIWFNQNNENEYGFWSDQLKTYVDDIKTNGSQYNCNFGEENKVCKVETEEKFLGPCTSVNKFGYKDGEPCVLIKLNRIYDWKPHPYSKDETKYLDKIDKFKSMPQELKEYIKSNIQTTPNRAKYMETVWISCTGENPPDRENMGETNYYPMPGIPRHYFPYTNQARYKSPFVMVHFSKVTPGVLISIECRAWAANIEQIRITRTGLIHFELMIDK